MEEVRLLLAWLALHTVFGIPIGSADRFQFSLTSIAV
jgi:hypothetical protein